MFFVVITLALLVVVSNGLGFSNGTITTPIGTGDDIARSIDNFAGDGRFVVAGRTFDGTFNNFAVARYWPDGSLDESFSSDGIVSTPLQINLPLGNSYAWGHDVFVDESNRIVVCGRAWTGSFEVGGNGYDFAVVRYLSNGTLDTALDSDGIRTFDMGARKADFARGLAVRTDGDIVVGGYSMNSAGDYDFAVARLNDDGSFDTAFDSDGRVTTAISSNANDVAHGLELGTAATNKISLVGYTEVGGGVDEMAFAYYNADGTLDTAFDTDGVQTTSVGSGSTRAYGVSEKTNEKFTVVGRSHNGSNFDVRTARFDGGDGGIENTTTHAVGTAADIAHAVHVEFTETESMLVGRTGNGNDFDFFTLRHQFGSTNPLRSSWSSDGIATVAVGTSHDNARAVTIRPGAVLVAGDSNNNGYDFAVARFQTNGAISESGDYDLTFSTDGLYKEAYGADTSRLTGIALASDGDIIAGGWSEIDSIGNDDRDFFAVRLNADGSLDGTFGTTGATHLGFTANQRDEAMGVAIDTQGRIIVAGDGELTNADSRRLAIWRMLPDGTLDTTFSNDGRVYEQFPSNDQTEIFGVLIGTTDRVVVFGFRETGGGDVHDTAVAMYLESGLADTGFSNDGKATVDTSDVALRDRALAGAIASDGSIIVGGFGRVDSDANALFDDWTLAKFETDGDLDSSFSNDGIVTVQVTSHQDRIQGLAIQTDGKIVVAGYITDNATSDAEWAVGRFLSDGAIDSTFSDDGGISVDVGANTHDVLNGVTIQPNGKIVAVGESSNDFLIVRVTTDGSRDTTFDNDGVRVINDGGTDELYAITIATDGRYIAAGRQGDSTAILRLWP